MIIGTHVFASCSCSTEADTPPILPIISQVLLLHKQVQEEKQQPDVLLQLSSNSTEKKPISSYPMWLPIRESLIPGHVGRGLAPLTNSAPAFSVDERNFFWQCNVSPGVQLRLRSSFQYVTGNYIKHNEFFFLLEYFLWGNQRINLIFFHIIFFKPVCYRSACAMHLQCFFC